MLMELAVRGRPFVSQSSAPCWLAQKVQAPRIEYPGDELILWRLRIGEFPCGRGSCTNYTCTLRSMVNNGQGGKDAVRGDSEAENEVTNVLISVIKCILHKIFSVCVYSFEVGDCLGPFYTGGVVQCAEDGQHMFCTCGSAVKVVQVETGRVEHSIEEVCLCVIGPLCVSEVNVGLSIVRSRTV